MIKTIVETILAVIEKLQKYHSYLKVEYEPQLPDDNFSSLSPIADADKDGARKNAWAQTEKVDMWYSYRTLFNVAYENFYKTS